jgi:hypothetical protein
VGRHFSEAPPACHGMCDVCAASGRSVERRDESAAGVDVLAALEAVRSPDKRATLLQILDRWRPPKACPAVRLSVCPSVCLSRMPLAPPPARLPRPWSTMARVQLCQWPLRRS